MATFYHIRRLPPSIRAGKKKGKTRWFPTCLIMAKVPVGKMLLRNVIRHTDAHNKIQEESEMWKLRDMELQTSSPRESKHSWSTRSSMHCDRYLKESEGSARSRLGERASLSERDKQEARYWTRKLYAFEANDPDRWGHSGFKELYPEEFESDGEMADSKRRRNGKGKISTEKHKKNKKSSKRRKKKKKKQRTEGSDSESDSSTTDAGKTKPKRKSGKSKHRRKKEHKHKAMEEDTGSTDDSESARGREKTHRKKRRTVIDTSTEPERKKRKNWKAANEEKSEESSED